MGKRGPNPGTKYIRRQLDAGNVVILNDRQLVKAQRLCESLDMLLVEIEQEEYPINLLAPAIREKLREYTEAVQHSVIEGIERFYDKRYRQNCET